jgi:hypothetical protein
MCGEPAYRGDVFSMSAIHVIAERLVQLTKQLHWLPKVTQHFTATDKKGTLTKEQKKHSFIFHVTIGVDQSTYIGGTVSQAYLFFYSS